MIYVLSIANIVKSEYTTITPKLFFFNIHIWHILTLTVYFRKTWNISIIIGFAVKANCFFIIWICKFSNRNKIYRYLIKYLDNKYSMYRRIWLRIEIAYLSQILNRRLNSPDNFLLLAHTKEHNDARLHPCLDFQFLRRLLVDSVRDVKKKAINKGNKIR